jgi:hypothetical protein
MSKYEIVNIEEGLKKGLWIKIDHEDGTGSTLPITGEVAKEFKGMLPIEKDEVVGIRDACNKWLQEAKK